MNRRGFAGLLIIGIIALITVASIGGYFVWRQSTPSTPSSKAIQLSIPRGTPFTLAIGQSAIVGDFWGVTLDSIDFPQHAAHISVEPCVSGCLINIYPVGISHLILNLDQSQTFDGDSFTLSALTQTTATVIVPIASSTQVEATTSSIATSTSASPTDTAGHIGWKTLNNIYGWSISYPDDWDVSCEGNCTPETADGPIIQSPSDCYSREKICGTVQIETNIGSSAAERKMSAQEYVLIAATNPDWTLLSQHPTTIGGLPGYEAIYLEKNAYPHGQIYDEIAVKNNGIIYEIVYDEENYIVQTPISVEQWTLLPVFKGMLSTFRLTSPDPSVLK